MPTVIGGKLKLKGAKKASSSSGKKSVKKKVVERENSGREEEDGREDGGETEISAEALMTDAERKHKKKMDEILKNKLAKEMSQSSYRDRVEAFNHKLATLTEHNDIPRVSAAGNG